MLEKREVTYDLRRETGEMEHCLKTGQVVSKVDTSSVEN